MAQITVSGKVGKDPTLKFIESAKGDFAVANFSIADNQRENVKGEWKDGLTVWFNISITGRQAELVADQITEYDAKDGTKKLGHEIKATKILRPLQAETKNKQESKEDFAF